jgi:putative alpha-1,2-mannosidase
VHRYTFPPGPAKIAVDLAVGGLDEDDKRSLPTAVHVQMTDAQSAHGWIEVEGQKLYFSASTDLPVERSGLWYGDARCGHVGGMMALGAIDHDHFKPFGFFFSQPDQPGGAYELRLGLSWGSVERAQQALQSGSDRGFAIIAGEAERLWRQHLSAIEIGGATPEQRTVFASALYHAAIKPIDCTGDGPFWQGDEPCWLDFATLWDQYKTLLPLQYLLWPERGGSMVRSLLAMARWHGSIPICQLVSEKLGLFTNQASALGHITITEACLKGVPGIDWHYALQVLDEIFPAGRGREFINRGFATPFTHTLDLADASAGMARLAERAGAAEVYDRYSEWAAHWRNAYNDETHRLDASNCYEGGLWNYSFRLAQCMAERIQLYPTEEDFVADLDRFFGYGRPPVQQIAHRPYGDLYDKGIASDSFEGLNNEPDMETPYAYIYAGRHDRTCEIVRTIVDGQFHAGRGGIPGNEDSGALSSWYVWSVLGLFPVAGTEVYLIGSPRFPWSRLSLQGGTLEIIAPDADASHPYVAGVTLNGTPLPGAWLVHQDIHAGGRLEVTMSANPTAFGRDHRPPSFSPDSGGTTPRED